MADRPPSLPRCGDCGGGVERPGYVRHRPDCPRMNPIKTLTAVTDAVRRREAGERQRQTDAYMLTETGLDTMWQRADRGTVDEVTLRADVLRLVTEVRRLRALLIDGTGGGE